MTAIRDLSPGDIDQVREIANIYLSELEVEENGELFTAACSDDDALGLGVDVDSGLGGFLAATVPGPGETLDDHFNRPTPVTRDGPCMVIQHVYLRPEQIGNGYGSALLSEALRRAKERDLQAVYGEAWIRPDEPDAVPLLDGYGFEVQYQDPDYWAHEDFFASSVPCPTHDKLYAHCPCEGAVYRLRLDDWVA